MPITRDVAIPLREVALRTSRSSGPGGQHANVTASRVEASFDVAASEALSEAQKARIAARCGPVVRAVAQDARSQARNRELALERLRARLAQALHVRRPRTATRPTKASKQRRADAKRRRSGVKRDRRRRPARTRAARGDRRRVARLRCRRAGARAPGRARRPGSRAARARPARTRPPRLGVVGHAEEVEVAGLMSARGQLLAHPVDQPVPERRAHEQHREVADLPGLDEDERLEQLVERAEAAGEDHEGVRVADEHDLAREEVVELQREVDDRVGGLLERQLDVQPDRPGARVAPPRGWPPP